jgi:Ricin-type beta-trefoil lectin domain-like
MKKFSLLVSAFTIFFGGTVAFAADTPEATTYQIRNVKHQELLRPRDANNATGTPLVLYPAQPWKCMTWRLQPAGESAFYLKNMFTGKTFSAPADTNAPTPFVTQIPLAKNGGESPAWVFTKLDDGSYKITDVKSKKVLTAKKSESESEVKISLAPWQNLDEQKWILEKIDPKNLTM